MESPVMMTQSYKEKITCWLNGAKTESCLKFRAAIIWQWCSERRTVGEIAKALATTLKTVRKWCRRFLQKGADGLLDAPRSGAPNSFDVTQRCEVIALACDRPQNHGFPDQSCWTLDEMTEAAKREIQGPAMSRSSIWRTLHKVDLKPHRTALWLHSPDPQFKRRINEIVRLYTAPTQTGQGRGLR